MFTINTEAGERVCVLHLKIPNVPTCVAPTVKREVREEQEKEEVCVDPTLPRPGSYSVLQKHCTIGLYVFMKAYFPTGKSEP